MNGIPIQTDQLSEMKGQFLASLNHEIRTPLTGILGMLDLLLETSLTEEQKEFAESSRMCAENLLDIMNSTLEYSALSANQIKLDEDEFPLRQLLESMLDDFAFKAKSKGLTLLRKFDDELPEAVIGDAFRMKQLLAHLVDNAVKFTHKGEIEFSAWTIPQEDGGILMTVSIRDTGIGIASDHLDCIFESFQQVDAGLSRRYTGMGLGLAVTQKLAKLMRAEVTVVSDPGLGSTFSVSIPLRLSSDAKSRMRKQADDALVRNNGFRILLVDDNSAAQTMTNQVLFRRHYKVDCVSNGPAAVEAASKARYDLILLDLQTPGMEGLRTSAELRALRDYADVPILAMTSNSGLAAGLDSYDVCTRNGMQGFVPKPVQSSELLRTVERFLPGGAVAKRPLPLLSSIAV